MKKQHKTKSENRMKKLENKTVFITGGISGIGKACAIAAAKEGANVAIADLKSATNSLAMEDVIKYNPKAIFIECDVSVFAQVQETIQRVVGVFGTLDIALNNAGIGGESNLGKVGFPNSSNYVAAKHGIIGLTQTAALEYAQEGIRINAICPGFIETPLLTNAGIAENTDIQKYIINLHPLKRLGKSGEVANGFIFLASDESSFITGTTVDIDGGYLSQ